MKFLRREVSRSPKQYEHMILKVTRYGYNKSLINTNWFVPSGRIICHLLCVTVCHQLLINLSELQLMASFPQTAAEHAKQVFGRVLLCLLIQRAHRRLGRGRQLKHDTTLHFCLSLHLLHHSLSQLRVTIETTSPPPSISSFPWYGSCILLSLCLLLSFYKHLCLSSSPSFCSNATFSPPTSIILYVDALFTLSVFPAACSTKPNVRSVCAGTVRETVKEADRRTKLNWREKMGKKEIIYPNFWSRSDQLISWIAICKWRAKNIFTDMSTWGEYDFEFVGLELRGNNTWMPCIAGGGWWCLLKAVCSWCCG